MDDFLRNCLEKMEEFQADKIVLFITSRVYVIVKVTTSGQIYEVSYCSMGQPYINILQYAFYRIVSPLLSTHERDISCFRFHLFYHLQSPFNLDHSKML